MFLGFLEPKDTGAIQEQTELKETLEKMEKEEIQDPLDQLVPRVCWD